MARNLKYTDESRTLTNQLTALKSSGTIKFKSKAEYKDFLKSLSIDSV